MNFAEYRNEVTEAIRVFEESILKSQAAFDERMDVARNAFFNGNNVSRQEFYDRKSNRDRATELCDAPVNRKSYRDGEM